MKNTGTRRIETDRLVLRRFKIDDSQNMFSNWANDDEVTKYLSWQSHKSREDSKRIISQWLNEYDKEDFYTWCIEEKASGKAIGSIGFILIDKQIAIGYVGYCLSRNFWNKGFMTEALKKVIEYMFAETGLNRIEAHHNIDNPASGRVMKKSGMVFEGVKRDGGKDNKGNFCDIAVYAVLRSDKEK